MQQTRKTQYVVTLVTNPDEKELTQHDVQAAERALREAGHTVIRRKELARGEAYDLYTLGEALPKITLRDAQDEPLKVDVLAQTAECRKQAKKLLISDMDSTMIQQECIDELAKECGKKAEVAAITEAAMGNKSADFKLLLRERLVLMEGTSRSKVDNVRDRISPMPGAAELLSTIRRQKGFRAAILVSGGFTEFTEHVAGMLGFDEHYGGTLQWDAENMLRKEIDEPIYDSAGKCRILAERSEAHGVKLSEIVALGDGSNDIGMLQKVHEAGGLAIAFHAKPEVQQAGDYQCINHASWRGALFAMGFELQRGEFVGGGRERGVA